MFTYSDYQLKEVTYAEGKGGGGGGGGLCVHIHKYVHVHTCAHHTLNIWQPDRPTWMNY